MPDPWGRATQGFNAGLGWQQHKAQLDAQQGIEEARLQLEQDQMKMQQEKHDWEIAQAEREFNDAQKIKAQTDKVIGLQGQIATTQEGGGKEFKSRKDYREKGRGSLLKVKGLQSKLAGEQETLAMMREPLTGYQPPRTDEQQVGLDYKKQLIKESSARVDSYLATAAKSVNSYGFTVEDAAKVLEGYNKYVNDFEKTTQNNIFSLISDKDFDPTTYTPPGPMSLEEYIESVKNVEAGLTGEKQPAGLKKSQPTIAPEDEELFR